MVFRGSPDYVRFKKAANYSDDLNEKEAAAGMGLKFQEQLQAWAAKLPAAFPVYPRGNTQEAAGTDEGQCALRVVSFLTPVALEEVLAFYYTRARAAGRLTGGAYFAGALNRPASIAASASVTSVRFLPK